MKEDLDLYFALNQVISFGLTVNTKQGEALVVLEFDQQGELGLNDDLE